MCTDTLKAVTSKMQRDLLEKYPKRAACHPERQLGKGLFSFDFGEVIYILQVNDMLKIFISHEVLSICQTMYVGNTFYLQQDLRKALNFFPGRWEKEIKLKYN